MLLLSADPDKVEIDKLIERMEFGDLMEDIMRSAFEQMKEQHDQLKAQSKREQTGQQRFQLAAPRRNAIWPLHRILAGMDTFGLPEEHINELQNAFGWTLSFSRAMHGGHETMRDWFEQRGVDTLLLNDKYQCMEQDAEARLLTGAELDVYPGDPGIQRVWSKYDMSDSDSAKTVGKYISSLVMYAPALSSSGAGKNPTGEKLELPEQDIRIPLVTPQMYRRAPTLTDQLQAVRLFPLIFTPPRIALAIHIAGAMENGLLGVLLTGVHGTGKTSFLNAMATVLPCGYPCDMLHIADAEILWNDPSACLDYSAQSSGPLVDARAGLQTFRAARHASSPEVSKQILLQDGKLTKAKIVEQVAKPTASTGGTMQLGSIEDSELTQQQKLVQADWSAGEKANMKEPKLRALLESLGVHQWPLDSSGCLTDEQQLRILKGIFKHFQSSSEEYGHGRVLILDEVNTVLAFLSDLLDDKLSGGDAARGTSHEQNLSKVWRKFFPWKNSPSGPFFRILASSPDGLREKVHDVNSMPFFELRPTRSDHLASVMQACPHFLMPGKSSASAKAALDPREQNEGGSSLLLYSEVCRTLCGNMRYVGKYVTGRAQRQTHSTALVEVKAAFLGVLVKRMLDMKKFKFSESQQDYLERPRVVSSEKMTKELLELVKMNASMAVRSTATNQYSPVSMVGSTVMEALREYAHQSSMSSTPALAGALMQRSSTFLRDGDALEAEVELRLVLGALSPRAWLFSELGAMQKELNWRKRGEDSLISQDDYGTQNLQNSRASSATKGKKQHKNKSQGAAESTGPAMARGLYELMAKHKQLGFGTCLGSYSESSTVSFLEQQFLDRSLQRNTVLWQSQAAHTEWKDGMQGTMRVVLSNTAGQRINIDSSVAQAAEQCRDYGTVLIRTAPKFPAVDFVVFRRSPGRRQVIFVECTKSPLSKHASGKDAHGLPSSFGDLVALAHEKRGLFLKNGADSTCATNHATAQPMEWSYTDQPKKELEGHHHVAEDTLANLWLRVLGCPGRIISAINTTNTPSSGDKQLVLRYSESCHSGSDRGSMVATRPAALGEAPVDFGSQPSPAEACGNAPRNARGAVSPENAHLVETDEPPAESTISWEVSIIYVGCAPDTFTTYRAYQQLDCDFAFCVTAQDMDDALDAWVTPAHS